MRQLKSALTVLLLGLTTVVVVVSLLLTLFLPTLVQRFGCAPYGIRCVVGQVGIRPHSNLTADLLLDHLILFDPDGRGEALRMTRLAATLNIPALIFARQVMPTEVRIESPELLFRRLDDGRWNLPALAQEVQQHLKPAAQPTTFSLPRVAVTAGTLQIGDHRVTDVNVALEPKPAPVLFEMQARAAVDGRSVQISGALRHTLDGQILAQIQEAKLQGALRFHFDQIHRAVTIPEWSLETEGAAAQGTAAIRYGNWPPVYTLTVAQWRANLSAVAQQLSFPWLSALTGMVEGRPTTLQGRWPELPVGEVAVTLEDGGLELPSRQFGVTGLAGDLSLQYADSRLRLQAALQGQTALLLGQRYSNPSLQAAVSVDTASGDITAEALRASISGAQIDAKGSGRRWGRDGLDLMTTELKIDPTFLTQLSRRADRGVLITTLTHPSIHLWWPGGGRPWKAEMMSRSIQLRTAAINSAATLHAAQIAMQGIGMSGRNLNGTLMIGQADLAGRQLRALKAGFEIDPDRIRIPEFHVAAGGGNIDGHASLSRSAPLQEARVVLSVRGLHPQSLFAPTAKPAGAQGVTLNADLSADTTFGGSQPPAAGGTITLRDLSLGLARQAAEPAPLLTGIRGNVAFMLDKGLLTIKETTLRTDGGLTLTLAGGLSLGHNGGSQTGFHLTIPWTEVAVLRSPLTALTGGGQPDAMRLTGQFHANLELIGQEYRGALSLRHVSMESGSLRLDNAHGVIPLHGRIDQSSTASLHQLAAQQKAGRPDLTEDEYRAALERLSNVPAKSPFSLAIGSLRYDPIELRHIEVALASSENRIAVRRFVFESWGGRWSGWGTVEPLGGGITLALLTEGLSLRAICNAFPPIKGYISGRIYGMAELVMPHFVLDQAHGYARFWAVDAPQEKRRISRRLIERLAGQQIRYFSLFGVARRYDRGVLEVALNAGDLIFHELEISHAILGYKDLDVRVSPSFNRIGLTHLLDTISETIKRIKASATPNH